jgi:hypothetical protein
MLMEYPPLLKAANGGDGLLGLAIRAENKKRPLIRAKSPIV